MIIGLTMCALALLVVPSRSSRARLRSFTAVNPGAPRILPWRWIVAGVVIPAGCLVGGFPGGCAIAILLGTAQLRYRRSVSTAERESSRSALLAGLEVLVAELAVGAHPAAASSVAGEECSGEVGSVFRSAAARARLGGCAAAAFTLPGSRIEREYARIGAVWKVADDHGLALAELLTSVRSDMLGRKRFRQRTESALAGARATATVLAGLPVLGIGLGQLMGASPVRILLGGGLGGIMLLTGSVCIALGLLWTDKITGKVML
ncbi:tight adherence protein B [Rhodococcus sp. 27YEA15]|uniref:type II secretion system F family protein n=1 Tax=Rhodococcus sp. 27YEA15 TaxID=3156259 RepID=UPI003C7CEBAA